MGMSKKANLSALLPSFSPSRLSIFGSLSSFSLMDSGNSSGSLQSSASGADDEYDSRAESISAFFNHPNPPIGHHHHVASSTPSNPPPPFIYPSSNYLDPIQTSSPSLSNFDMVWSRPARSDPNRSDLGGFNPSSSSNQQFFSSQLGGQTTHHHHHPLVPESSSRGLVSVSGGGGNVNDPSSGNNNNNVVRNPKKRSRASRRAPTTVLTTDTTNFRAMVQEFTGIPAPPFSSSPFQRSRLDLLGSHHSAVRSPPPPTYNLLRPFAQKPQSYNHQQPFLSSLPAAFPSTAVDPLASSPTTNSNSILYPTLSSDLSLIKQPSLNVNIHNNPVLHFPSSIQLGSSFNNIIASKTQAPLGIPASAGGDNSHLKMGVLEEFGLNHVDVNTNISGLHHHHQDMASSSLEWAERTGTNNNGGGDHGVMRSASGNLGDNSERDTNNGKVMTFSSAAASSDFHGEKATATRSEGMVESWINCSTD